MAVSNEGHFSKITGVLIENMKTNLSGKKSKIFHVVRKL